MSSHNMTRRSLITGCAQVAGSLSLGSSALAATSFTGNTVVPADRQLSLYNIHTGESVKATFFAEGTYQMEELHRLDLLLRDHRNGEINAISRALYDRIFLLQKQLGARAGVHIISGYRSPETNKALRQQSSGVAKKSLHMQGKAVDITMPGISHKQLHQAARALREGGVGYYPGSGFVHLDCGRTRHWVG